MKTGLILAILLAGTEIFAETSLRRIPECGVEGYKSRRDPICGNIYKNQRSYRCGVESYNSGYSWKCPGGQEEIKKRVSSCGGEPSCPGSDPIFGTRNDWWRGYLNKGGVCATDTFGRGGDRETRHIFSTWAYCTSSEITTFCAHSVFGVKNYNLCRHPGHGFEQYKECEDLSFGKIYRECEVTKDKAELTEYIENMENMMEPLVLAYASGTGNYLSLRRAEKELGCTIHNFELKDRQEITTLLKTRYFIAFLKQYDSVGYTDQYCSDTSIVIPSMDDAGCESESSIECNTLASIDTAKKAIERETDLISILLSEPVAESYEDLSDRLRKISTYLNNGIIE